MKTFLRTSSKLPKKTGEDAEVSNSNSKKHYLNGRLKLNGITYHSQCQCDDITAEINSCIKPVKFRVRQEELNRNMGLSATTLHSLLGKPSDVGYVDLDHTSHSCLDGGDPNAIIGTIGGDFGEFLLALAEYEHVLNKKLTQVEVEQIFRGWIEWSNRHDQTIRSDSAPPSYSGFYYHTDDVSIDHLQKYLRVSGIGSTIVNLDLTKPPVEWREELLKDLVNPKNQGCDFIKAVLSKPELFYMGSHLTPSLITAFFKLLWDRETKMNDKSGRLLSSRLNFIIFDTQQEKTKEKLWINFKTTKNCERNHRAPAFRSLAFVPQKDSSGAISTVSYPMFVNHPNAAHYLRERLTRYFALLEPALHRDDFLSRLDRRGTLTTQLFAELYAPTIPFYTIAVE